MEGVAKIPLSAEQMKIINELDEMDLSMNKIIQNGINQINKKIEVWLLKVCDMIGMTPKTLGKEYTLVWERNESGYNISLRPLERLEALEE